MRLSKLWREKLNARDDKEYSFEYSGQITLKVDGYEIAKDWIDPELYESLNETLTLALTDCIRANRTPLFDYREKRTKEERYILGIVSQYNYLQMTRRSLLDRCMKKTKLSEPEVIKIILDLRPEFASEINLIS